jgi:hypothetical protein
LLAERVWLSAIPADQVVTQVAVELQLEALRKDWSGPSPTTAVKNRKKRSTGSGTVDEKPIAAEGVKVDLVIPAGLRVTGVDFRTAEEPTPAPLQAVVQDGRVRFAMPRFLVYAIARVKTAPVGK